MADIVIRGATIVDGTGSSPFVGDIAILGDKISAVGPGLEVRGREEIDARGRHVLPGWIDPHTHFDAQWSWDPYLLPIGPAGVTTCVMGNCGIGFAPCQSDRREFLASLMEAVEDIPGRVIAEGLVYDFETFEEYLDSIERKAMAVDIAVLVGHCAVRTWVMGQRASLADRPGGAAANPVKAHEIEAMAALVRDAVAAGAFGFSTSRLLLHRDPRGTLTPGALAGAEEVHALIQAIADGGGGVFEMSTDWSSYDDVPLGKLDQGKVADYRRSEGAWMVEAARKHGQKVAFTYNLGASSKQVMEAVNEAGGLAMVQSFLRVQGFLLAFGARLHPFILTSAYREVAEKHTSHAELLACLQRPDVRSKILKEAAAVFSAPEQQLPMRFRQAVALFKPFDGLFRWTPGYEPVPEDDSVEGIAAKEDRDTLECMYDMLAQGALLWKPQPGTYKDGNMDYLYEYMQHPNVIPGFADGGAHGTMIQDAVAATHSLTHFVRDRSRGPRMPIELAVQKQTADVARLFGLGDRGVLAPGKKADLNVVELAKLVVKEPRRVSDLPLGQERWTQEVDGYELTLVSGQATFRAGRATGALPGRLVRNPRRDAGAHRGISASVSGAFESGLREASVDVDALLDGFGEKGMSAAARVLRSSVEADGERSRL